MRAVEGCTEECGRSTFTSAASCLSELQLAEKALLERMAELANVTCQVVASRIDFTAARFRISHASLKRSTSFNRAVEYAAHRLPAEEKTIFILKVRQTQLLAQSRTHKARWPTDESLAHWMLYREASKRMLRSMKEMLQLEQELLHPMLIRLSNRERMISLARSSKA